MNTLNWILLFSLILELIIIFKMKRSMSLEMAFLYRYNIITIEIEDGGYRASYFIPAAIEKGFFGLAKQHEMIHSLMLNDLELTSVTSVNTLAIFQIKGIEIAKYEK